VLNIKVGLHIHFAKKKELYACLCLWHTLQGGSVLVRCGSSGTQAVLHCVTCCPTLGPMYAIPAACISHIKRRDQPFMLCALLQQRHAYLAVLLCCCPGCCSNSCDSWMHGIVRRQSAGHKSGWSCARKAATWSSGTCSGSMSYGVAT
jgi:hypothetical protein